MVGEPGNLKSKGTGEKEKIECGILFRSIGYRGTPIKGLPFHEQSGVIPNQGGRIMDAEQIYSGLYATGWIKRGPTGVIGTNKRDSEETVKHLLEDMNQLNPCKSPSNEALMDLLKELKIRFVSFADWEKIDAAEVERGKLVGKPREKFVTVEEMLGY